MLEAIGFEVFYAPKNYPKIQCHIEDFHIFILFFVFIRVLPTFVHHVENFVISWEKSVSWHTKNFIASSTFRARDFRFVVEIKLVWAHIRVLHAGARIFYV